MSFRDNDEAGPFVPDWTETPLKKNKKIQALVTERQRLTDVEKEVTDAKKAISTELLSILTTAQVDKARIDDFTIGIVTTERTSLNEGLLKQALVEGGMQISAVEKLWKKCCSTSKSSYIKVTERKQ